MKRLVAVAALLLCFAAAYAYPSLVGTITSSGSTTNNQTTATTFTLSGVGAPVLALQCDAAACVKLGLGSSTTASCAVGNAAKGVAVAAGQLLPLQMAGVGANAVDTIAVIPVSGSVNCDVFRMVDGP